MFKKVNEVYVSVMNKIVEWKKEEKVYQTLEWLGIAAVVVIIVDVISTAFGGEGSGIGDTIKGKFKEFIETIGGGK